jgi:RsiW-degrading membrane proteinase PrsW (M82 family)
MRDELTSALVEAHGAAERAPLWLHGAIVVAAVGGGWTAVAIAILPGFNLTGAAWLLLFLVAPFYEEALKPLGVYFVFLRWPHVALSRLHVASLAAAGGLTFALVESWLYVEEYPDAGDGFVLFRFTAPVAMHVLSSFVLGLGLSRPALAEAWRGLRLSGPLGQAYVSAVTIHMVYNLTVLLLLIVGIRDAVGETGR